MAALNLADQISQRVLDGREMSGSALAHSVLFGSAFGGALPWLGPLLKPIAQAAMEVHMFGDGSVGIVESAEQKKWGAALGTGLTAFGLA